MPYVRVIRRLGSQRSKVPEEQSRPVDGYCLSEYLRELMADSAQPDKATQHVRLQREAADESDVRRGSASVDSKRVTSDPNGMRPDG